MQIGAASVSNGLQHEPKTNGKIISSSKNSNGFQDSLDSNSDRNSNQLNENEEQWDWCKGLPPKSSNSILTEKQNASAYILPKENLMTKSVQLLPKKPTLSPNYIHMYKIVEKCAHYQQAHVILEKTKSIQNCESYEKIAWIFIVYN